MGPAKGTCAIVGLMAAVLLGCDAGAPAGKGTGTGGVSSGGVAGQNSGGAGGGGGQATPSNPFADVSLDDSFPWFLSVPPETSPTMLTAQPDGARNILHVAVPNLPSNFTVSTHDHFDVVPFARTVSFSARLSKAGPLRVSLRRNLDGIDYFAAVAAARPWSSVVVQAGTGWQQFDVAIGDLSPDEPITGLPPFLSGFTIAFVVETPDAVQLDLDDVYIR